MGIEGVIMNISNDYMIGALNRAEQVEKKDNAALSQQDFLRILAAEISNPSFSDEGGGGSGGQADFMGAMLQMNLIDQITELNKSMQNKMFMSQQQQALSLVGKEVTLAGKDDGLVTGVVQTVRFKDGFASFEIDGSAQIYNLGDIISVGEVDD